MCTEGSSFDRTLNKPLIDTPLTSRSTLNQHVHWYLVNGQSTSQLTVDYWMSLSMECQSRVPINTWSQMPYCHKWSFYNNSLIEMTVSGMCRNISSLLRWPNTVFKWLCLLLHNFKTIYALGPIFLQESRLITEVLILAFWLGCVLLPWQWGWLKTRLK